MFFLNITKLPRWKLIAVFFITKLASWKLFATNKKITKLPGWKLFNNCLLQRRGERILPKDKLYTIGRYENINADRCLSFSPVSYVFIPKKIVFINYKQKYQMFLLHIWLRFTCTLSPLFFEVGGEDEKWSQDNLVPMLTHLFFMVLLFFPKNFWTWGPE